MKKTIIIAAVAAAMCSTAAYAQSIDLNGDVTSGKTLVLTGLEDGYYDLTVTCQNDVVDENTYVYGVSENYTMSSTVLPKSEDGVKVTVRGIGVTDGQCEVGVTANENGTVVFSDADIEKSVKSSFITGGDMTEVSYIEDLGGIYRDADGNETDVFKYLAENGVNMARIRLSNTTGKGTGDGTYYLPEGYQDEEDCLKLAKRAKDAGMGIQFTFNYSDYWSNGERQIIPSKWVEQIKNELGYDVRDAEFLNSMSAAEKSAIQKKLGDIVYEYTRDYMLRLKAQNTLPEYVSLGNEINGGMFFPFANTYDASMNSERFELVSGDDADEENDIKCYKDWAGLASILNRGYDAVKEVSPNSQVVIHLANGSKDSIFEWFFKDYIKAGGKVDVIGASYYPAWSYNSVETCVSFCNNISKKFNKDILIMETGYNWTENKKNGSAGQLTPTASESKNAPGYTEKYPFTLDGHKGFMADLINGLKGVDGGRCVGLLYWDPCMIHVEDTENPNESLSGWAIRESDDKPDGNVVENTTLFDFDGKALPTVQVFKNNANASEKGLSGEQHGEQDGVITVTVANASNKTKKASLFVAVFDDDGILTSVRMNSKQVKGNTEETLSIEAPNTKYKTFLWNGDTFAPITK